MMPQRKSAFSKVLKEAQQQTTQQSSETVKPEEGETVERLYGQTVIRQHGETVTPYYGETEERLYSQTVTQQEREQFEKTTFYLTGEQVEKLDDLAHDYKKLTGQRINRNDIVRYLIDQATLESLEGIKRHTKKR